MKKERNALQEKVFPKIRELCEQHGARLQVIDLRWGVSEEASLDQQTVKICIDEIKRCQNTTPRPNFIVLLGDRYGWRPLPAEIPVKEFDMIIKDQSIKNKDHKRHLDILKKWYKMDKNAIPAVYCLLPREGQFRKYKIWQKIEQDLSNILRESISRLSFSIDQRIKYEDSATEQEIIQGVINVKDANEHVFCFFRRLEGLRESPSARDFLDINESGKVDHDAHDRLQKLKDELHALLPKTIFEYSAFWNGRCPTSDHISILCKDVEHHLSNIIKKQIDQVETTDPLNEEIASHDLFAKERTKSFAGRKGHSKAINNYVNTLSRHLSEHPLVIYGKSGSGKSALMAYSIDEIRNKFHDVKVVSRFIGSTPESVNGQALLTSLCREISRTYGLDEATIPSEYKKLVEDFTNRLGRVPAEKPLVLFLDALDQLSDADNARNLIWLPSRLPANVGLIVSALDSTDSNVSAADSIDSNVDCLPILKRKTVKRRLLKLESMSLEEGSKLLDMWLKEDAGRILQPHQRKEVLDKFSMPQNGMPLYLRIAFEEARQWKSYSKRIKLNPDIPGLILQLFDRLSANANHGRALVSRSIEYLVSSKNGLTEDELLGLLSENKNVISEFKRRSSKSPSIKKKLPVVIWSRLYFDLKPYLIQRRADETLLLSFFHRQFMEIVKTKYLVGKRKIDAHRDLSSYFGKQIQGNNGLTIFNTRQLSELPFQLRKAKMWKKLEDTLCNLQFIYSKCGAGMVYDLIMDYNASMEPGNLPHRNLKNVQSFARFIRTQSHVIAKNPKLMFQQAFNEPDNTAPAQAARRLLENNPDSYTFLRWNNKEQIQSPCLFTLNSHTKYVNNCDVSPDGKNIVSASSDGTLKIWKTDNGKETFSIEGHKTKEGQILSISDCRFSKESPKGTRILSADRFGRLVLWDSVTLNKITPFFGNKSVESDCSFSFDGNYIVTAGKGREKKGIVSVYDGRSGKLLFELKGHKFPVKGSGFSPDGSKIVSGDTGGQVILWDVKTRQIISKIKNAHSKSVWKCIFFKDKKLIVSASEDGKIKMWDSETLKPLNGFKGHKEPIWACSVSPDGKLIASGSFDKTLKIWDIKKGCELATLEGHEDQIWDCAFFPDGKRIVSASWDTTLKIWDISQIIQRREAIHEREHKGKLLDQPVEYPNKDKNKPNADNKTHPSSEIDEGGLTGPILCSAISPDNRIIVSGSWDGWIRRFEINTGTELNPLHIHKGYITALSFSPNGKSLLVGDDTGKLKLFDTNTWAEGLQFHKTHTDQVTACSFSADGEQILSSARDKTVKIWKLSAGGTKFESDNIIAGADAIESCAISPDASIIAMGTDTGKLRLWDTHAMKEKKSFFAHKASVLWCTFSPTQNQLLSASMDGTLKLWDLDGNFDKPISSFNEHTDAVQTGYFCKDGNNIVSASWDRTLKVWHIPTEKVDSFNAKSSLTLQGHTNELQDGRFSPDCQRVVSASMDGTMRLWDVKNGSQIALLIAPPNRVQNLEFSPKEGKSILTCSHNRSLKLWNTEDGEELMTLHGHTNDIQACIFSPDGKQILSASSDQTLRLWDTESGHFLDSLEGHKGPVQSCDFSKDGKWIVSASWDRTIKLWDAKNPYRDVYYRRAF